MSDSFDADLQSSDPTLEGRHRILMERTDHGPGAAAAIDRMKQQLSGAAFTQIDEATGVFEIAVEAADRTSALERVVNAMAAAGADDHLLLAEHTGGQHEH